MLFLYKVFIKIFDKYYSADIKDAIEQGRELECAHRELAYDEGYEQGYNVCRKETLKEVYEKLVQEIKETTREEILAEIKERYTVE